MNLEKKSDNLIDLPNRSGNQMRKVFGESSVELNEPPVLLLDEAGMIKDCNKSVERLFGYRLSELAWQHVSRLFPQLSGAALIQKGQVNPKIGYISRCGHIFHGLDKQGNAVPAEMTLIRLEHDGLCTLRLILRPSDGQDNDSRWASL
jgi:PAS domain S-box-containing protein